MYVRKRHIRRPDQFHLREEDPLYAGLVFAGLGGAPHGTTFYKDSARPGRNGTLVAGAGVAVGTKWLYDTQLNRRAIGFAADGGYLKGPPVAPSMVGTFSAWFRTSVINTNAYLLEARVGGGTGYINNSTTIAISSGSAYINGAYTASPPRIANAWTHLAVTGMTLSSPQYLVVSAFYGFLGNPTWELTGQMADWFVWTRTLPIEQLAILANRGDPMLDGFVVPDRRRVTFAPMGTNRRRRLLLAGPPQ